MKYKPYFLLLSILPLMAATCKNNTIIREEIDMVMCDGIQTAVKAYWILDISGAYAPDYVYYCDMIFVEAFEQAFSEDKSCKETLRLDEMKNVFGEPTTITSGVDATFNLFGPQLRTMVDETKAYQTVVYECVTNAKSGEVNGICPSITRRYYFLFEETGSLVCVVPMQGTTGWLKPKGK